MKTSRVTIMTAAWLFAWALMLPSELPGASQSRSYDLTSSNYTHYGSPYRSGNSCPSRYYIQPRTDYRANHYRANQTSSRFHRSYYTPSRYRTRVDVTIRHGGGFHITGPIPGIIDNKRRPEPPVLAESTGYLTREYFLIDTLRRDSVQDRELAAIELAEHHTLTTVAALTDALINDSNAKIRIAAAKSLSQINLPAVYRPLLRARKIEHEQKVLTEINQAINVVKEDASLTLTVGEPKNITTPHGSHKLARHLENLRFGRSEIRHDTVEEMADYKNSRSVAALIHTLINDKDSDVRKASAISLKEIADPLALDFLKAAAKNDIDSAVQKQASNAIETIYNVTPRT